MGTGPPTLASTAPRSFAAAFAIREAAASSGARLAAALRPQAALSFGLARPS